MPDISRDEVQHLARLARLRLSDEEIAHYADQLTAIVEAVARVSDVAAADTPPTSHPVPMVNVFRADEVRAGLPREAVAAMAPAWEDDRFRVPRILGEE